LSYEDVMSGLMYGKDKLFPIAFACHGISTDYIVLILPFSYFHSIYLYVIKCHLSLV